MIIKHFEFNKSVILNKNLYLLYGKNEGMQNEIIKTHFVNNFDGTIIKYEQDEFISNFENIISEILNKSLFDDQKIIIVSRVSEKITKFVDNILEKKIKDVKIIFKAGLLEKRSKLRILFENSKHLVSTPFYEDNFQDLSKIVHKFLKDNNIKISMESINLLVDRSSGSRENLKIELNKLYNYSYTKKNINIDEIKKLSNLAENYGVDKLADKYLSKDRRNVAKILNENNFSDEDCVLIIRTLLIKSKRLLGIIENYKKTKNIDDVISKTRPPNFWKDKQTVKTQVKNWELEDLKIKIYEINDLEILVKSNSKNSLNIVSNFIVNY